VIGNHAFNRLNEDGLLTYRISLKIKMEIRGKNWGWGRAGVLGFGVGQGVLAAVKARASGRSTSQGT